MELIHKVNIPKRAQGYDHTTRFSLWGSCFSSELTAYLQDNLFTVHSSPFGIMYNPASIAKGLQRVLEGKIFDESELFEQDGIWYSNMHHGDYASHDKGLALSRINEDLEHLKNVLKDINVWVFTFGTSYIYEEVKTSEVVNNCHRRPAKDFSRRRLTVEEIVSLWKPLVARLQEAGGEVIFTVSPICHYRDGAHESRLSKAVLLLAIDALQEESSRVGYFPSYEIMMDELRDYRFYAEDLVHPSLTAVRYIMERFAETHIDALATESILTRWSALRKLLAHRPMTTHPDRLRAHYFSLLEKLEAFRAECPNEMIQKSITQVQSSLAQIR
ncbi:GSCFA domain-containing protein [Porphyromonas cangingivalis]|uniref:GSCFA domain-containing protein n=1 Tax=Porphyromonas cangingivalis TaxID=36874 RepID=UPI0024332BA8|nr:GSCFA domain-containing protein [Porphyromonas cangingivalis]